MTAITITISSPSRAIVAEGRLVAGETAEVSIEGVAPSALYLVAPDQTVVAACEAFTPKGQGTGGVGFLQLATEQIAALFANTPAGRMIAVWALINGADGVAGAGWVPVLSAPMPDELVDLDIDFYLRASQVGAGLAIVDGKLVCTVNPATYLTKAEAAQTYATQAALAGKQDTISDLATIRAGAAAGATAYQKPASGIPATDLAEAVQTSLSKADGAAPQESPDESSAFGWTYDSEFFISAANGALFTATSFEFSGGDVSIDGLLILNDWGSLSAAGSSLSDVLHYVLPSTYITPDPVTGKYALNDREANWIKPAGASVTIVFPPPISGRLRDFEIYVESQNSGTGNVSLTCEGHDSSDVLTLGNGGGAVPDIPLGGDTVLYFSEVREGHFLLKGEEFKTIAQGGN